MPTSPAIILICPDQVRRETLKRSLEAQHATVVGVLNCYPNCTHLNPIIDQECDGYVIELDSGNEQALDLVEKICSRKPSATVMVYSDKQQPELLVASMRAGAREFLTESTPTHVLADALLRLLARRAENGSKKPSGKVLIFWGAKGGSGVTTLATNFAIALRHETGGEVALVDLNPHLGDIAVLLGITPRFTIADALLNPARLDEEFVSTLVTEHRSGVSVLAAPDAYSTPVSPDSESIGKLLSLVAARFPYAVIDAGIGLGAAAELLFQAAGSIYVVTQVDIPSLRNSQRFISYVRRFGDPQIELVLNRFEPRKIEFDDERLTKVLGLPAKWKMPNDYQAVRRASNTGTPLISEKSALSPVLFQMARAACGKQQSNERKRSFGLFA